MYKGRNVACDAVAVRARDGRAKVCIGCKWITNTHLCGEFSNAGNEPIKNVTLRVEARGRRAVLATVHEGACHCTACSGLNVGISKDNERRLSAELSVQSLHRWPAGGHQLSARCAVPRWGNGVETPNSGEGGRISGTGDRDNI